eukprot:354837_1
MMLRNGKRKMSTFVWQCTKCFWYQLKATQICRKCEAATLLRLRCKCGTMNDIDTNICSFCNEYIQANKSMEEILLKEDIRQIEVFLAGCCNINSHQTNISLLYDGLYRGLPHDIIAMCAAFCFNLRQLEIIKNEEYKEVWDTYPYTSNIAKLDKHSSQIWIGKNEIDYSTIRKVWSFKVSKGNMKSNVYNIQFSFTIGISKSDYTKNYQFHIMNGYVESSKIIVKNNDIISMVYVKYENIDSSSY